MSGSTTTTREATIETAFLGVGEVIAFIKSLSREKIYCGSEVKIPL